MNTLGGIIRVSDQMGEEDHGMNKLDSKELLYQRFLAMGPDRSLKELAANAGMAHSTIKKYSSQGKWADRIAEDEAPIIAEIQEQTKEALKNDMESVMEDISKVRQINRILVNKFLDDIEKGTIKLEKMSDFVSVGKLIGQLADLIIGAKPEGEGLVDSENMVSLAKALTNMTDLIPPPSEPEDNE